MNTGSQSTMQSGMQNIPNASCAPPTDNAPISHALNVDWKVFSFRNVVTPLYCLLEEMEKNAICSLLHTNINALQDCFLEQLYDMLALHSVDLEQKITLGLDEAGTLAILSDHTGKKQIQLILQDNQTISDIFKEIYIQSLALRNLVILQDLAYQYLTNQQEPVKNTPLYHVNIKGEMSHFFFLGP